MPVFANLDAERIPEGATENLRARPATGWIHGPEAVGCGL